VNRAAELAGVLGAAVRDRVGPLTLAAALVLAGAWLIDRALARRVSAGWRLAVYGAVLARVALPVGWHSPLGLLGAPGAPPVLLGDATVVSMELGAAPAPAAWTLEAWLGLAYGAGVLFLICRIGVSRLRLGRALQTATPVGDGSDAPPIWRHATLGPFVAGLWRPRILLPAALADAQTADAAQARAWILRHERAHVRRRDPWLTLILQLACSLAWPILPVWLAARRIRALMEEACDERAIEGADGAARRRYGELLLALASERAPAGALAHALGFPALGSPLRARLRALGARRRWPVGAQVAAVAALGALALACGGDPGDGRLPDASTDAADAPLYAHQTVRAPAAIGGGVLDVPGYRRAQDLTPKLRLDPALSTPAPGSLTADPGAAGATPSAEDRAALRAARLRQFAPNVRIGQEAEWLCTPRRGCTRLGGWKPIEVALREAMDETDVRALLVDVHQGIDRVRVDRVLAAARRAGVLEQVVSVVPAWAPDSVPSAIPGARNVGFDGRSPILSITGSGDLYLGPERVTAANLESKLARWLASSPSKTLLIRGDRKALASTAIDVMGIAKRAGAVNVGLLSSTPTEAPAVTRGSLDKEIIRVVIRQHIGAVKACYERALAADATLSGRLQARFTITATGLVDRDVAVEGPAELTAVGDCLANTIRTWRFPAPEGGGVVIVSYPFSFLPRAP
jgi:biopolymer transport protein ExbD